MFRAQKPKNPTINWKHPTAKGLVNCFLLNEKAGKAKDLVQNDFIIPTNTIVRKNGIFGSKITPSASSYFNLPYLVGGSSLPISMAFGVEKNTTANNGLIATSEKLSSYYGIWVKLNSDGSFEVSYGDGGGSGADGRRSFAGSGMPSPPKGCFAFSIINSNDFRVWFNGTQYSGAYSGTGYNFNAGSGNGTFGYLNNVWDSIHFGGNIYYFYTWNRALTKQELINLTIDPYRFLIKKSIIIELSLLSPGIVLSTVNLSWVNNDEDYIGVSIERSSVSSTSGFSEIDTVTSGITSYNDSDLSPGTYWYRIRSYDNFGRYSDYSNIEEITVS